MQNKRPCFQLFATGNSRNGWMFRMRSKAIFTERSDAEAHVEEFKRLCTDEKFFECAHEEGLEIKVVELELY